MVGVKQMWDVTMGPGSLTWVFLSLVLMGKNGVVLTRKPLRGKAKDLSQYESWPLALSHASKD